MRYDEKKEIRRVRAANWRARRIGAEASLTLRQWLTIVNHYGTRCAYCGLPGYDVMDHAAGIAEGTHKDNCRPACYVCNTLKGSNPNFTRDPTKHLTVKERRIERVWSDWEDRSWTEPNLIAYAKMQIKAGRKAGSVYQIIGQLDSIARTQGLPSLLNRPTIQALRAKLLSQQEPPSPCVNTPPDLSYS